MTEQDTSAVQDIPEQVENVELAQIKEEFRRIRGLSPQEEVPENIIKCYNKYKKQRSISGASGPMLPVEKLIISTIFDVVEGNFEMRQPKPLQEEEIFGDGGGSTEDFQEVDEEEFDHESYEYEEGEKVAVEHDGKDMLGEFTGHSGDMLKINIGGDSAKFRKKPRSKVKPFKD